MAGREDFGILRLRALVDDRLHLAAENLPRFQGSRVYAVAGIQAALGGYLARETDDGVLRGDGTRMTMHALSVSAKAARALLECLKSAELLRSVDDGLYLVGFREAYLPIIDKRRKDRERKRVERASSVGRPTDGPPDKGGACPMDVARTSERSGPVRPVRTDPPGDGAGPKPLTDCLRDALGWVHSNQPLESAIDRLTSDGMTHGGIRSLLAESPGRWVGTSPLDFASEVLKGRRRKRHGGYAATDQPIAPAEAPRSVEDMARQAGVDVDTYLEMHPELKERRYRRGQSEVEND